MKNTENTEKKPKNLKKFKYGSMSVVVIALVVAIVVVINIIVSLLMNRYPLKLDLTADKRYELCEESIDVLGKMEKDVEITVTMPRETLIQYNYYQMIPEILDKYSVYAEAGKGSVTVDYVDITKDPDVVSKYSQYYNGTITEGCIVVYSGEKVKVLPITNLFTSSSSSYYSTATSVSFVGESTITSAIMSVTDANPMKAAFTSLINEAYVYGQDSSMYYSTEQLKSLLASNGYEFNDTGDIDVMKDEFSPEDYDLLVIPAPSVDFNEDVIAKLEDFLYNEGNYGKHVIYISGLASLDLPNIEEFLAKWNIQIEDTAVMDDENMMQASLSSLGGTAAAPIVTISDTEAVGELPNESLPIVAPLSREVTILSKNGDIVSSAVLTSSSTSYAKSIDGAEIEGDAGSRNVAVLSKRERGEGLAVYTSSVLAIGSAYMSDPSIIINTSAYNNANFLLNSVNTMTGKENSFVIPQKNLQEETLALTAEQVKLVRNVVIYIIPLIVVVAGVIVFIRRKNR